MIDFLNTLTAIVVNLAWLWEWLAILALACLLITAAANGLVGLLAWIDRRNAEQDATEAADWGEPTRAEIEAAMSDTPICDATVAHIAHHEAADIDAEWAAIQREISGGAA